MEKETTIMDGETTINKVKKEFASSSDVLVVRDNKPFGVLYAQDLYNSIVESRKNLDEIGGKNLITIISEIRIVDHITGLQWTKENDVRNFVRVTADESLLDAKTKMYGLSNKVNDVRCVVVNDLASDLPIGIFSYDSILYFTK